MLLNAQSHLMSKYNGKMIVMRKQNNLMDTDLLDVSFPGEGSAPLLNKTEIPKKRVGFQELRIN